MTVEKEDLGLSLSLSFPQNRTSSVLQLNLMPSSSSSPSAPFVTQTPSWIDNFPSLDRNTDACRGEVRSFLRGIDVNRLPSTAADGEEEAGVSSPISTVSSVSGKRSERDQGNGDDNENEMERSCSRGISDEEDGDAARKKLRLSKDQSAVLEESFKEHNTLNPKQKLALAKRLGLRPRQVEVWFQNRRARLVILVAFSRVFSVLKIHSWRVISHPTISITTSLFRARSTFPSFSQSSFSSNFKLKYNENKK